MSIDYPKALKAHLDSSLDPLWAPVVMTWLARFDGWWNADREELRNPAYAIALEALQREVLRQDARRTAQFLAHLPFNRWHAVTVAGERKWNPLEQAFEEFRSGCLPQPIVTFVAPDFSDRRLDETAHWLWAAWRVQWIGKESPDA